MSMYKNYLHRTVCLVIMLIGVAVTCSAFSSSALAQASSSKRIKLKAVQTFKNLKIARPLLLTHPGDGSDRIFVIEQVGRVVWFDNNSATKKLHVALDFSQRTGYIKNEEGLMGIAFHPDIKKNKQVFLHYTAKRGNENVLSRFKMNDDLTGIDPKSEQILFTLKQPYWNHNGGMIQFGKDGFLYIALGDGGSRDDPKNNGQNKKTWFGAMLRIDVDVPYNKSKPYTIPKDNPFADGKKGAPEIFAYGLRNVWRFSIDRKTGRVWAGDVGQDLWEEINLIESGGNYGWPVMEGNHKFTKKNGDSPRAKPGEKMIGPVVEHNHASAKSITGGYVYRGKTIPALNGAYIYGDYQTGLMWYLTDLPTKAGDVSSKPKYIGNVSEIASFGEDRDGEIYVISLKGKIYKIVKGG
jgi:glucose/arabinose dehydrogenase